MSIRAKITNARQLHTTETIRQETDTQYCYHWQCLQRNQITKLFRQIEITLRCPPENVSPITAKYWIKIRNI